MAMVGEQKQPVKHDVRLDLLYFIAVTFLVLLVRDYLVGETHIKTIAYSEFRQLLDKGEIKDLVIGPTRITGAYTAPADSKSVDAKPADEAKPAETAKPQHFTTVRVDPQLADELMRRNITFSGQPEPGLFENLLSWLVPTAGFVLFWLFVMRPRQPASSMGSSPGRSRM